MTIPKRDGKPLFEPSTAGTLVVAFVLLAARLVVVGARTLGQGSSTMASFERDDEAEFAGETSHALTQRGPAGKSRNCCDRPIG